MVYKVISEYESFIRICINLIVNLDGERKIKNNLFVQSDTIFFQEHAKVSVDK